MGPIINPSVSKIMHPLGVVNFFQKMLSTSTMNAKLPNFGTSYWNRKNQFNLYQVQSSTRDN